MNRSGAAIGRARFLRLATWCEGAALLIALALAWALNIAPLESLSLSPSVIAWAALGTLPPYLVFVVAYREPGGQMRLIKDFLVEHLGPPLSACSRAELIYVAALAGIGEELLFRGVLQIWLERHWGWLGGLVFSNMLFALLHWVTPLYGLLAGITGIYLGWWLDATGERNLAVPMLIHGTYDFLAFLAVAESFRQMRRSA